MNRLTFVIIILLFSLAIRFYTFYSSQPNYQDEQEITFSATLLSEPKRSGKYQTITINLKSGEKVFITTTRFPEYSYAQTLHISGPIRILPRAGGFQPRAHEGRSYGASTQEDGVINKKNVILTMSFPKIEAEKQNKNFLLSLTAGFRQKIVSLFNATLPSPSSSLLLGIVFGIKEGMTASFKKNLQATGVLHVVAASGMNVTMVGGFLSSVFIVFFRRQVAVTLAILGVWFYAFVSGFEASIVRASIMGSLVFSAQILGRQYLGMLGLFIAAYLMLFISPLTIFDVGFQLSFAATAGLIVLPKIREVGKVRVIGDDINTTIAAQIATLPILLTTFGTYSLWSIIVNAILLWTIPILMALGGLGAILGFIHPFFGQLPLYLSLPFLNYFEWVVDFFGNFGTVLKIENLPWQWVVSYYAVLILIVYLLSKRKTNKVN